MIAPNQAEFQSCYRNRLHPLFDFSYIRASKVRLIERMLAEHRLSLETKKILDFGFGAGAFLRACPASASLFGTEIDPVNVADVAADLADKRPSQAVDLRVCDDVSELPRLWPDTRFDVIVLSHVLEHVEKPESLLAGLRSVLVRDGNLICLVPINEIEPDPKHLWTFTPELLTKAADAAGMVVERLVEDDRWLYWVVGSFSAAGKFRRLAVQAITLSAGIATCAPGWKFWTKAGRVWGALTRSKPTQLAALLKPCRVHPKE